MKFIKRSKSRARMLVFSILVFSIICTYSFSSSNLIACHIKLKYVSEILVNFHLISTQDFCNLTNKFHFVQH
ncbi:hypothetical protein GLOIN_2v1569329 [Rhizophagus irregularis DAOM 181602=DAOM 197198]|nr:hypothetical protein GLOIN_2v1569329 [Rhizophagus irregularis DAOM 181602=DAOM 197198]